MTNTVWERHANPWSCYTRFTALPLLAIAIWSREWIGIWALAAVLVAGFWIWLNPRLFPPPKDLDNWASRGVLGERVYLRRRQELRAHHRHWAVLLAWASLPGAIVMAWGLWSLDASWAVLGTAAAMGPKLWFIDRMVWAYQDWLTDTGRKLGDV